MSDSLRPHVLQHTRLPCPSPTPRACSDSSPLSQWCHPIISSYPFSFGLQSFPVAQSFVMSQLFAPGRQSIGTSALASVLLMNIQNWFTLGLTGLISLQSKGLSRVFSNTTVQINICSSDININRLISVYHLPLMFTMFKTDLKVNYNIPEFICSFT